MKKSKKSERVMVRLSPDEKAKLSAYAERKGQTESWIVREYIRRLPSLPKPQALSAIEQPLNLPIARIAEPEPFLVEDIDEIELPKGTSIAVIEAWEARGLRVVLVPKRQLR